MRLKIMGQQMEIENEVLRQFMHHHDLIQDFSSRIGLIPTKLEEFNQAAGADKYIFGKLDPRNLKDLNEHTDNMFRASVFMEGIERGMPLGEAARWTQKYMFNYRNGLTPFEQNVMRRFIPFYTFSRFNIPLALETLYKTPGFIAAIGKTKQAGQQMWDFDEMESYVPEYVRQAWGFNATINKEKNRLEIWTGHNLLSFEDLGFLSAAEFWRNDQFKDSFFKEVVGRLNPLMRAPMDMIMDRDLMFGKNISDDQIIKEAHLDVPGVREFLKLRHVSIGDKQYTRVDGDRYILLNQLHMSRLSRTIGAFYSKKDGDTEASVHFWEGLVPFLTGLKLRTIDLERQYKHAIQVANFRRADIKRAIDSGDPYAFERLLETIHRGPEEVQRVTAGLRQLGSFSP